MVKPRFYFWALGLLVLLSCHEELGDVGFKNPNRDFQVVSKEFIIPTRVFQMDSLSTSNGYLDGTRATSTDDPPRFLVGSAEDPRFGKTTAIAYSPYWAASFPVIKADAEFISLELTLVFDYYYWTSNRAGSGITVQVHEVTDSIITYKQHFSDQPTPTGRLLGEAAYVVTPEEFDENIAANADANTQNDIIDSINFVLNADLGRDLLAAAKDTVGSNELNYVLFRNFRKTFKGLSFSSPNADKIVGFNPHHSKSRIILKYKQKDAEGNDINAQLRFLFTPSQQASGTAEYMSYTELRNDRSGTALAGLPEKYVDYQPSDGNSYIQAGTGIMTKLDFSEVYDYFKNIPTKALSVAELRIETPEQANAPTRFKMRALRADNRERRTSTKYTDSAGDPYDDVDGTFVLKHSIDPTFFQKPYFRCDVLGDDSELLMINRVSAAGTGSSVYAGYLTNFMQQELSLGDTDVLRYFELIPQEPDIAHGVHGLYFPANSVKLTIYYTTQNVTN